MSTTSKPTQPVKSATATPSPAASAVKAAPTPVSRATTAPKPERELFFLFDKENYMLMLGGILLILLGFMLMSGGKSADPHVFLWDEIYSVRRITIAPIVLLAGFVLEVYAIMKKPKEVTIS